MRNRWLDVPAADYEGHMNSPEVDQSSVLSRLLGEALAGFQPRELLLLGCATGNGLSQVDPGVTLQDFPDWARLISPDWTHAE